MELIIKPTEACNFACTFCSSTEIANSKKTVLSHDLIFKFLERFPKTKTIIVNGGDPLMVAPKYYWTLIQHLEKNNLPANISLTTNLWAFYKNPQVWQDLLRHPRISVCTSFNFGETRRVSKSQVYTEELFWNVSDLFLEKIGYRPDFISVINSDNEDSAIENVLLAKKMGVVCKLNYAFASGAQSKPYLLSKIYSLYIKIHQLGLTPWEFNTQQMIKRMNKVSTICPQSRTCDSNIRALQPDGDYYSCGAFGDDRKYPIDFQTEMQSPVVATPLSQDLDIQFLKSECFGCQMFDICNGCKKTIVDLKKADAIEEHCSIMKAQSQSILNLRSHKNENISFREFGEIREHGTI